MKGEPFKVKTQIKANKKVKTNNTKKKQTKKKPNNKKKSIIKRRIAAILLLVIFVVVLLGLIVFSGLFNIKHITIRNNNKVSTEEILQNSHLVVGTNMFKILNINIINGIKANPYIEDVKVTKKLNGEVIIDVQERVPTFILTVNEEYAYINNQGYILEVSPVALELPTLEGVETTEIASGGRLNLEDLKKLDVVIQIMNAAEGNGIKEKIAAIDISDSTNFVLKIPSENKTVDFGDGSNINVKILWIIDLMNNKEKGVPGTIVLNVPNIKKVYFREQVWEER